MPNTLLPSVLGNVVANRDRLSAIRKRISLEGTNNGPMRSAAPMPPGKPAMTQTNPGNVAMTGNPTMDKTQDPSLANAASGNMETGFKFDDATRAALLPHVQQFLQQVAPQQQALIDQQKQQVPPAQQQINDPAALAALAPLATFFRQNGRLPTPQELQQLRSQGQGQNLRGAGVHASSRRQAVAYKPESGDQEPYPVDANGNAVGDYVTPQQMASLPQFAGGGHFMAKEKIYMVGQSGRVYGVAGEAGMDERVSIQPTNHPHGRTPQRPAMYQDGGEMDVDPNDPTAEPDYIPDYTDPTTQDDGSTYDPTEDTQPQQPYQPQDQQPPTFFPQQQKVTADDPRIRQRIIDQAVKYSKSQGWADPSGEIGAALDGLDGYLKGQPTAPEWDQAYGTLVSDLTGQSKGFKVAGGTGQSFGSTSPGRTPATRDAKGKVTPGKPIPVKGGPVHFGNEPAPQGSTQYGAQAVDKKPVINTVQDYVNQKGELPSLDELYNLGVTQALGGAQKATPKDIFNWRVQHLSGTDKEYFSRFGKIPSLKDSVNFEAQTVLRKSLGRDPTPLEKYNYLSAHAARDESLPDLLQGNRVPSADTLRRLEMANIVSTTTAPKAPKGKQPKDYVKLVTAKALADARKQFPDEPDKWQEHIDKALDAFNDYQSGSPVDAEWIAEYGSTVDAGPGTKVNPNLVRKYPDDESHTGGPQGASIEEHLNR